MAYISILKRTGILKLELFESSPFYFEALHREHLSDILKGISPPIQCCSICVSIPFGVKYLFIIANMWNWFVYVGVPANYNYKSGKALYIHR